MQGRSLLFPTSVKTQLGAIKNGLYYTIHNFGVLNNKQDLKDTHVKKTGMFLPILPMSIKHGRKKLNPLFNYLLLQAPNLVQ